jgi:hypothetical protein
MPLSSEFRVMPLVLGSYYSGTTRDRSDHKNRLADVLQAPSPKHGRAGLSLWDYSVPHDVELPRDPASPLYIGPLRLSSSTVATSAGMIPGEAIGTRCSIFFVEAAPQFGRKMQSSHRQKNQTSQLAHR